MSTRLRKRRSSLVSFDVRTNNALRQDNMEHTLGKALTVALALICAISFGNSVYSQSKEATVIEQADEDNPDLKLTLEIYPTEI